MNTAQLKQLIKRELPTIVKEDAEIQQFILDLARTQFADKIETESRFDRLLDELRRDREEQSKKWEEENKKWEEENKKWEEQNKKWEEQNKKWVELREELRQDREEQNKKWEENQQDIRALFRKYDSGIGALGARWGLHAEESFRNALHGILEDSFGVKVLHVTEFDYTGEVFGNLDQVEIDVLIKDGLLILCEIKSSMSRSDVYTFGRKVKFYEKLHQCITTRKIIISPMIEQSARLVAEKLGIDVYSYAEEVQDL